MKYPVSQIKSLYEGIDFLKVKSADIVAELKNIQDETADFTKTKIIEINAENFADLYDLVVELYPSSIAKAEKAAPKKKQEFTKPAAKKQAAKKPAVKKDRPTAKKTDKSLEELSAEDKYFEECKTTIRDRNQAKKAAKLVDYKAEKIKALEEKGEVTAEEKEAIENMTYSEAFTKKKSLTLEVTDTMFSVFEKIVKTNYNHIATNSEFTGSDKSYRFKQATTKVIKMFVDNFLPELHKSLTGAKAASYIENFTTKADKQIAEYVERLDKKFAKKELKEAA